jgi:iron complex transport system ATP-binding protein
MTTDALSVSAMQVHLGARPVLSDVSLKISTGELVCLLGPNGAGKTTLLRAALGLTRRDAGDVLLGGTDPVALLPAERARLAAYLPQRRPLAWALSVRDVVALGRYAHGGSPGRLGAVDASAVDGAIESCGLQELAARTVDTLSGGELSRVHVARAIAAGAPLLVADEPIAALDPLHQFQVMALLRDHVDAGNAALVVLHDVALAARFSDRLAWLVDGRLAADGPPGETLTETRFAEVYGINAAIARDGGQWSVALRGTS